MYILLIKQVLIKQTNLQYSHAQISISLEML